MIRKLVIEVEILEEVEYLDDPDNSYTSHEIKSVRVNNVEVEVEESYGNGEGSAYRVFDPNPNDGGWRLDLVECDG